MPVNDLDSCPLLAYSAVCDKFPGLYRNKNEVSCSCVDNLIVVQDGQGDFLVVQVCLCPDHMTACMWPVQLQATQHMHEGAI